MNFLGSRSTLIQNHNTWHCPTRFFQSLSHNCNVMLKNFLQGWGKLIHLHVHWQLLWQVCTFCTVRTLRDPHYWGIIQVKGFDLREYIYRFAEDQETSFKACQNWWNSTTEGLVFHFLGELLLGHPPPLPSHSPPYEVMRHGNQSFIFLDNYVLKSDSSVKHLVYQSSQKGRFTLSRVHKNGRL